VLRGNFLTQLPTPGLWVSNFYLHITAKKQRSLAYASDRDVAVSRDGRIVWVTALQSNALLGFSVAALPDDPAHALRAVVRVGSER
jgi:hypothetical protein